MRRYPSARHRPRRRGGGGSDCYREKQQSVTVTVRSLFIHSCMVIPYTLCVAVRGYCHHPHPHLSSLSRPQTSHVQHTYTLSTSSPLVASRATHTRSCTQWTVASLQRAGSRRAADTITPFRHPAPPPPPSANPSWANGARTPHARAWLAALFRWFCCGRGRACRPGARVGRAVSGRGELGA